MDMSLNKLSL